jgi:hypothetical protein
MEYNPERSTMLMIGKFWTTTNLAYPKRLQALRIEKFMRHS